MVGGFDTTYTNFGYPTILKVTIPKEMQYKNEGEKLHEIIKAQVGDDFLPIVVPEGVTLEIVD